MTSTRPDLCYVVTRLAQHMSNPTKADETKAKHVLRYLKGTMNQKLIYTGSDDEMHLIGYCDADSANSEDRKSITGYTFQLVSKGAMISWKSRKQRTVALSTCEAEYMALAEATQEAIFLTQLFKDMTNSDQYDKFILYCDNQSAIALAKNAMVHQRSKHIDIKYHFVRSIISSGVMELVYIAT